MFNIVPSLSDCRSLQDVRQQSKAITTMATDLLNEPIVQEGYALSGQCGQTAFINAMAMAKKRLIHFFPGADWKDPLYERMMAEAKLICAECIHLKYECRERRQPYNHLIDATERIRKMVRDKFVDYENDIKRIVFDGDDDAEREQTHGDGEPGTAAGDREGGESHPEPVQAVQEAPGA